uniref:Uncharacterized protein n=1 Tax=Varanus komodoensis TaxID=61221 RepID=A0A8D2KUK6_VARKO
MAVRGRAAAVAAVAMAAVDRRLPSLDDFAGQSWSAWVERAGPPTAETGESRRVLASPSFLPDRLFLLLSQVSL